MSFFSVVADNVSDEIIYDILEKKLDSNECSNGFVMTDFPRTVSQAEEVSTLEMLPYTSILVSLNIARNQICIHYFFLLDQYTNLYLPVTKTAVSDIVVEW